MSICKETLLLKRDLGGLLILFIMPLVLVVTVTIIQDSSFKQVLHSATNILVVNKDQGDLSKSILEGFDENPSLLVVDSLNDQRITEEQAQELVLKGAYQMAIVIPENLTENLNRNVNQNVAKILAGFGLEDPEKESVESTKIEQQKIKLFFDPTAQISFKTGVINAVDKMVSKIETGSIYAAFQNELETEEQIFENVNFITFEEVYHKGEGKDIIPSSVQHNVPAWTLFAIFFIVIPLSINIVKEKNNGTFVRLKIHPTSFRVILGGKIITYLCVCMFQFTLMLLVGLYLFPHIGLPELEINGSYFLLFVMAIFSGLAAIGFGILLGTIANTQEQAAPFGATSVVILAAIGGAWVPTFVMPKFMQIISQASPINWGLNGFYDIILRNGTFADILPEICLLSAFFFVMMTIAIRYNKIKNMI